MENNLVLSAAVGYKFEQIEFFIKSLRKFYKGEVCIVIDGKIQRLKKIKRSTIVVPLKLKLVKTRLLIKEMKFLQTI